MTSAVPPPEPPPAATVLTPAGPVPADKVQHVRPGQAVRRNADGQLEIVEDSISSSTEESAETKEKKGEQPRPDTGRL